jgi:hypothetical protein
LVIKGFLQFRFVLLPKSVLLRDASPYQQNQALTNGYQLFRAARKQHGGFGFCSINVSGPFAGDNGERPRVLTSPRPDAAPGAKKPFSSRTKRARNKRGLASPQRKTGIVMIALILNAIYRQFMSATLQDIEGARQ